MMLRTQFLYNLYTEEWSAQYYIGMNTQFLSFEIRHLRLPFLVSLFTAGHWYAQISSQRWCNPLWIWTKHLHRWFLSSPLEPRLMNNVAIWSFQNLQHQYLEKWLTFRYRLTKQNVQRTFRPFGLGHVVSGFLIFFSHDNSGWVVEPYLTLMYIVLQRIMELP